MRIAANHGPASIRRFSAAPRPGLHALANCPGVTFSEDKYAVGSADDLADGHTRVQRCHTDPGKSSEYHCVRHAIHRASCPATLYLTSATRPLVALTRPMMARAKVDLPHPDSPTTPNVSPSYRRRVTPSTALSVFGGCQNHCLPSLISKCTFRSAISRRTFLPGLQHS